MNVYLEVDGQPTPIADCSWYCYSPCGCCSGVTVAVRNGAVLATEDQAWLEFEPNSSLRKRDRQRGYELKLGLRKDVRTRLALDCPHIPAWGHVPTPTPDGFVWATHDRYPSARDRAHLVPVAAATPFKPGDQSIPLGEYGETVCGVGKYRWWTSSRTLADAVACTRCVRVAKKLAV